MKAILAALCVAALASISSAWAQSSDCRTIQDAAARLKCFDSQSSRDPKADLLDQARQAVIKKLRDPESARFRNVRSVGQRGAAGEVICGEVNAKNDRGGYVGFRGFFYSTGGKKAYIPGGHAMTDDIVDQIAGPITICDSR